MDNPRYLGDGVYARFDGYGIWLLANDHLHPTDKVYLEPEVLQKLINFTEEIISCTKAGCGSSTYVGPA